MYERDDNPKYISSYDTSITVIPEESSAKRSYSLMSTVITNPKAAHCMSVGCRFAKR